MATKTNPMFDFDMSKFDMTKMFSDLKMPGMEDMKMPGVDTDAMMATQRKNIEAFTAANQCAMEGMGTIVRRQSEIAREAVENYGKAFGDLVADGTPEERMQRHAEFMKTTFETSMSSIKELGDIATKTQEEAASLISSRIAASFDEAKGIVATK